MGGVIHKPNRNAAIFDGVIFEGHSIRRCCSVFGVSVARVGQVIRAEAKKRNWRAYERGRGRRYVGGACVGLFEPTLQYIKSGKMMFKEKRG